MDHLYQINGIGQVDEGQRTGLRDGL